MTAELLLPNQSGRKLSRPLSSELVALSRDYKHLLEQSSVFGEGVLCQMSSVNFIGALLLQSRIANVKKYLEQLTIEARNFFLISHIDHVPNIGPCLYKTLGKPALLAIDGDYAGLLLSINKYPHIGPLDNDRVERLFNDEWYTPRVLPYDIFDPESACVEPALSSAHREGSPMKLLLHGTYHATAREAYKFRHGRVLEDHEPVPEKSVLISEMLRIASERAGFSIDVDALHMTRPTYQ